MALAPSAQVKTVPDAPFRHATDHDLSTAASLLSEGFGTPNLLVQGPWGSVQSIRNTGESAFSLEEGCKGLRLAG
eukprot:CAMPEP_0173420626 /NCGR_PEP_ID=MMETSP1357-20121228/2030_1 /TAXON_ID=77926 /ORGANISM="Hemiselmis rufescens, Strain PCC563" /LENGTH=74 /DNA_ID=CAMNT_0014383431 /DNA_START=56 /DNA_END=277 /DNA_ORIENTATION=-